MHASAEDFSFFGTQSLRLQNSFKDVFQLRPSPVRVLDRDDPIFKP